MKTSDRNNQLYSSSPKNDRFISFLELAQKSMNELGISDDLARVAVDQYNQKEFYSLINKYSTLPDTTKNPQENVKEIVEDLFIGIPNWSSPKLLYNVGTSVNRAAASVYALSLNENIYNINDGLAGNSLVAEHAVTKIISDLANLSKKSYGIFTFGGTATNLYGMRLGLKKAFPNYSQSGIANKVRIFVTEDSHFSHSTGADWLGVGTDNVVTIKSKNDRTSDITDLEKKIRLANKEGYMIGSININGGTTYDHAIDDIAAIVALRDKLVLELGLTYIPHVHVDSVIGWIWLFFNDYDWKKNPLTIEQNTLIAIKKQYMKIQKVRLADSWGVDFHKSIGGCPVNCSLFMINNFEDAMYLSRKKDGNIDTHQLAQEYSFASPVDYTLETSRSAGAPLAALTALFTQGKEGYQINLANLIQQSEYIRTELKYDENIVIANNSSSSFVTMLRVIPPDLKHVPFKDELTNSDSSTKSVSDKITKYTKDFFEWDYKTRIKKGIGPEYSYSSSYTTTSSGAKLGAIKLYPVSPFFSRKYATETVKTVKKQIKTYGLIYGKEN